jgi:hypothetical protein
MKRILVAFAFLAVTLCGAFAAGVSGDRVDFGLPGVPLELSEMEETVGGLPRCCHDLDYDPIEDKCLNNKGQEYVPGKNDCDTWIEKVLSQAGIDISPRWGNARATSVGRHVRILDGKLSDKAPLGWSIQIIDNEHVTLMRVNKDGSADVYHQGFNHSTPTSEPWEGSRGYHYDNARDGYWGDRREFWDFR